MEDLRLLLLLEEGLGGLCFRECDWLLYGRRCPLMLKGTAYESYVKPAILYGSEACCLRESEMVILRRTEISMVKVMCGVQLKDKKKILIYILYILKYIKF